MKKYLIAKSLKTAERLNQDEQHQIDMEKRNDKN